ncbi:MAG: DUF962 domain-containing protein [Phycisphaerales bacterium]|nr:DUF962 domain-containing protein [Phycisphaerales bacterium]
MNSLLANWLDRHRHPASRTLHAIGIPLLVAALVVGVRQLADSRWDLWWRPLVLLAVSYLLQWVGHRIEGNDMGEIILVKKWLGRPYVAVAPRYAAGPDAPVP